MYIRVIIFALFALFISGCSIFSKPKPVKKTLPDVNITKDINTTVIVPIKEDKIVVKDKKYNKYNLKPEPFSLESNEDDPELLGPQTTLNRGLDEIEPSKPKEDKKIKPIVVPNTPKKVINEDKDKNITQV